MGQIQRVQSIFLFLASLFGSGLFAFPFATAPQQTEGILLDGSFDINDHIALMVLTALIVTLSLLTIFLYNNRKLQMNLGTINLLLTIGLLGFAIYLFTTIQAVASIGLGLFLPLFSAILVFSANVFIRKDEKLVRDSDRLR